MHSVQCKIFVLIKMVEFWDLELPKDLRKVVEVRGLIKCNVKIKMIIIMTTINNNNNDNNNNNNNSY